MWDYQVALVDHNQRFYTWFDCYSFQYYVNKAFLDFVLYVAYVCCGDGLAYARFPLPELTARVDEWPVSITRQLG